MGQQKITVETRNHVLLIGLNRPEKRNAFDVDMYIDLAKAYGELQIDKELRCGLIFAHGDHFTSGLDLAQWAGVFAKGSFPPLPAGAFDPLGIDEDRRISKPVVMAIQGLCYTIGIELMLACDVRIASTDTSFRQMEVCRGIYPVGGATVRLLQEIGWGNAMRYLLTGDEIRSQEAFRLGLVQELTEPGRQFDRALELAKHIALQAPLGVQASLLSARTARLEGDKAALSRLLVDLMPIMKSADATEGVQSFLERREAVFKGR